MNKNEPKIERDKKQLTTFCVGDELFGIEVMEVQEVTGKTEVVSVPLAPKFVRGLINLRGQIATAVDLKEVFSMNAKKNENEMSVVCEVDESLISLIVDSIGDVVEVSAECYEHAPDTISDNLKKFIIGVYKVNTTLISVLNLSSIGKELALDE